MSQLPITQVFMSYSRRDKDAMWRTATFLRKQGVNVWVDNEKLIPGTLRLHHAPINWKGMSWVVSAWAVGGAIGWLIGRYFQQNDILDTSIGWAIGYAISWAIGGFVLLWRIREEITDIQHS